MPLSFPDLRAGSHRLPTWLMYRDRACLPLFAFLELIIVSGIEKGLNKHLCWEGKRDWRCIGGNCTFSINIIHAICSHVAPLFSTRPQSQRAEVLQTWPHTAGLVESTSLCEPWLGLCSHGFWAVCQTWFLWRKPVIPERLHHSQPAAVSQVLGFQQATS